MLDLYLHHGRFKADGPGMNWQGEEADDWGFDGPHLKGCIGTHTTYGAMNVWFKTKEDADEAHRQTGWAYFDECALRLPYRDDCVAARIPHPEGGFVVAFFGDWGLIVS